MNNSVFCAAVDVSTSSLRLTSVLTVELTCMKLLMFLTSLVVLLDSKSSKPGLMDGLFHRMHEDPMLDCILGSKNGADSMSHYVFCPHLFAFQRFLFGNISADPLMRFGIKSPNSDSFKVLSCLFSAYHALKGEIRSGKINVHSVNWLKSAWSVFAFAIKAEEGEMSLATRAFSLPKFISFLIHDGATDPVSNSIADQDTH